MSTIIASDKPINAASYSRLKVFRTCQKQAYLKYILKLPEADRPPLAPGKEYPNDRGQRVHDLCDKFVNGDDLFPNEAIDFEEEIRKLKRIKTISPKAIITEDTWCFDNTWNPVDKKDFKRIWLRVILDVIVFISDTEAIIIDYKTGRREGNEVDHARQMQLYQLIAFMLFPNLRLVHTELWYLDQDEVATMTFTRRQGMRFYRSFNDEFVTMTTTTVFKSNPNRFSCMFCPYKTGTISKRQGTVGTGDCDENP